jgi:hypothetical protein
MLVVLFLIVIMFMHVTISLKVSQRNEENDTRLIVSLLKGLLKFKIEIPKLALTEIANQPGIEVVGQVETAEGAPVKELKERAKISTVVHKLKIIKDFIDNYWGVVSYLLKAIKINKFSWVTEFGTGDAAVTGVATGVVWTLKGGILSILSRYLTLKDKKPELQVIPRFQQGGLYLDLNCIFAIRIGHIIIATIRFVFKKFLRQRG